MPSSGYFDTIFAQNGDVTVVPDPTQGSGAVSYNEGFGVLYQTPVSSGGLNIPRSSTNQIFYDITSAIQRQQQGLPAPFITSSMNGGTPFPYAQFATVFLTGQAYTSNTSSNTTTPPSSSWTETNLGSGLPGDPITGAGHNFVSGDNSNYIERSNSGTAMSDLLPGTSGALPNGWFAYVKNTDSAATDTIAVGAGGTIKQGNLTGNAIILPGELWFLQSDGAGVYNVSRISNSVISAGAILGSFKNLKGIYASNTTATYTADQVILSDGNGNTRKISAVSKTLNTATSGAGGLDTGSLAASTWYYVYLILNLNSNTQNIVFSLSASAPTLPAGYTYYAMVGIIRTDGSSNIIGFTQYDHTWKYLVGSNLANLPIIASGSTSGWQAASILSVVPTAISGIINGVIANQGPGVNVSVAPNANYAFSNSTTNPCIANATYSDCIPFSMILESTNIYYEANGACSVACIGFDINF